jgi:hypothetical protein
MSRAESYLGKFLSFEYAVLHTIVSDRIAAISTGGIHYNRAFSLAGSRVSLDDPGSQLKLAMSAMERTTESELHQCLRRVQLDNPQARRSRRCGGGATGERQCKRNNDRECDSTNPEVRSQPRFLK